MKKKTNWVYESHVPEANRFEIRQGNWASAPYGMELTLSRHNNQISVVIEMARQTSLAKKLDKKWPVIGYGKTYEEKLVNYTVVERREKRWSEPVLDTFPAVVEKEYLQLSIRREFGTLFQQFCRRTIRPWERAAA